MYGPFVLEIKEYVNESKSWSWVENSDLKSSTIALIFSVKEQALKTDHKTLCIDNI